MEPIEQPVIRAAAETEAAQLSSLAMRSKAYWGYSDEFMEACRDELTLTAEDLRSKPTWVAEADSEVVGFYALAPLSADEAELGFLFVEPAAIGHGYGRALIEHAKAQAREMGYRTLVIPGDPNAERFYLAAGGVVVGTTPSGSIPGRELPLFHIELG
ncbi:MAG: GNAT family N-acetyltransferase [Acidobacteriota bacterium]